METLLALNMDTVLKAFVGNNYITLLGFLGLCKIIAKETPWAADDRIIQILMGWMKK